MREVQRGAVPDSLKKNAEAWTKELEDAVEEHGWSDVPDRIKNRYNQPDVRQALVEIYGGCCCYCDASVDEVAYNHIEHRKPKSKYPELAFAWDNLHLSCPRCNRAKSNTYDENAPILDPVVDRPISDHLSYQEPDNGDDGMFCRAVSDRGATTIKHAKLDRQKLCRRRLEVYLMTLKVTNKINRNREDPNVPFVKKQLALKAKRRFGSVIAFALEITGVQAQAPGQ